MPMQRDRYPAEWEAISKRIRFERAKGCCEWCGKPHGQMIYVMANYWWDETIMRWRDEKGQPSRFDTPPRASRQIKVVLTVAHLGTPHADGMPGDKHDKMDVREENLAALCQRCHLLYDIDEHIANAAKTRRAKRIATGQLEIEL